MISFAHSFWTKPMLKSKFVKLKESLAINLVDYALSVEYVHRNGYKISLYTDKLGAEIFSPIPYDKVIILENGLTDSYHFAASFKFLALENMSNDEVLIDGDIFLKKPEVYQKIENEQCDILVSMFEPKWYIEGDGERNRKMLDTLRPLKFKEPYNTPTFEECDGWYNTSLMKFNMPGLKEEYVNQYKKHLKLIEHIDFGNTWPDIILEQRHLTQLCRYKRCSVHTMAKNFPSEQCNNEALKLGFTHLGMAKGFTQNKNINTLMEFNKELCMNVIKQITDMTEKLTQDN